MQSDFTTKNSHANALSHVDRETLETKVIPTAKRWMKKAPVGSTLWEHGRKTLEFWGRLKALNEDQDNE